MAINRVTVSIENLAPEQGTFLTPLWFGFHNGTFDTYDRGRPVSPGLERLAEDGLVNLISQEFDLSGFGKVQGVIPGSQDTPGPIDPGETATFTVELDGTNPTSRFFNYASMIIPSNDFFIANGNERAHQIFDDQGNFIGTDFIVLGNNVLDAGSEVNDEIPANTAFFGQQNPDTGTPENGVVTLASGFIPGGNILSDSRFTNADFTTPGYQVARIRVFAENPVFPVAEPVYLSSLLTGTQERPLFTGSTATGISQFTLNETGDALKYSLTISGLDFGNLLGTDPQTPDTGDDVTMVHIHDGGREDSSPLAFNLTGAQDADDLEIVKNADGSVTLSGIWEQTDNASLPLSNFVSEIRNAQPNEDIGLYWNIHTNRFPGGEIRGQFQAGQLPPSEPLQIRVVVENLAPQQGGIVTPFWFGLHDGSFNTFDIGQPASSAIEIVAEEGFIGLEGLTPGYPSYEGTSFENLDLVNIPILPQTIAGLFANSSDGFQSIIVPDDNPLGIPPGELGTQTFTIQNPASNRFFSYAAMYFPSNDAFIADQDPIEIFDSEGNFIGADFIITGDQVWDAGTEVNDELLPSLPFSPAQVGQGTPENGNITAHPGFLPPGSGGVLDLGNGAFANADFTTPGYQVARVRIYAVPTVSVFAEPASPISELNQEPGAFIFKLSAPAPEGGLVVNFQAGDDDPDPNSRDVNIGGAGTTNIDDFNIRPIPGFVSSVTISEGATEARLVVTPFADGLVEPEEVISVNLLSGEDYNLNPANISAGITIIDGIASGLGGQNNFVIRPGNTVTITDFGGIGRGVNPANETVAEVDTLQFEGAGLTAENLLLLQDGNNLQVSFAGIPGTQVTLQNLALEDLDNLRRNTGARVDLGNILFDGDTKIQDSFDVINANANPNRVFNRNTVTFLNEFDNVVRGFNNSDDVINGQGGDDTLWGLSGDDILRGGLGEDFLFGGRGEDTLVGGWGDDRLYLGNDRDIDTVVYNSGDGTDIVYQFTQGVGGDVLSFEGIVAIDVVTFSNITEFRLSDGIQGNSGFGAGDLLVELNGTTGFTADNIGANLAATNTAAFLFA
ncbi:CHRD domain-containing protein [Nostoc sp. PCC 7524]|uniref:spondin domain-containing protein n=1 Tax=Nostoc sp. (strain ATCC 29411 / PCC 7524) TaxID=28072 RepID=UPI00029ED068|nr:spondin domain-containing protein [Nostoc sp. PCC 7524]AFY47841.1 CHRD domain-containing protein [Nostoc sp. PCC 7524]